MNQLLVDNNTPYTDKLLWHTAGVYGEIPPTLKRPGNGYVHQPEDETTKVVDIRTDPAEETIELVESSAAAATCEVCVESSETATQIIEHLIDHPSLLLGETIKLYYGGSDRIQRFRFGSRPSGSLSHAVKTFATTYTAQSAGDTIDRSTFVDRFRTWHENIAAQKADKSHVYQHLNSQFDVKQSETTSPHQQQKVIVDRRWTDELTTE